MAQVILDKIQKIYERNVVAIKEASLKIEDHEFMVLVGPSGCGKSTLLRMIAGLEEITSGELKIGERVVNKVGPGDRDIAFVFQNYALYPNMSLFDNMAFPLKQKKRSKENIKKKVNETAEILGIKNLLYRKPAALSGGERQRVALGRAMVRDPKVFLLDEPLSNLDAKLRISMRKELLLLQKKLNATMIYVTHDQVEAMTLGHRVCVINEGIIQQVGKPRDVYNRPANKFVAGFLGTPPTNFFTGNIDKTGTKIELNSSMDFSIPENLKEIAKKNSGTAISLGVRPEDITIGERVGLPIVEVHCDIIEELGDQHIVYGKINEENIAIKTSSNIQLVSGQKYKVSISLENANLFREETGQNLFYS